MIDAATGRSARVCTWNDDDDEVDASDVEWSSSGVLRLLVDGVVSTVDAIVCVHAGRAVDTKVSPFSSRLVVSCVLGGLFTTNGNAMASSITSTREKEVTELA